MVHIIQFISLLLERIFFWFNKEQICYITMHKYKFDTTNQN